MERPLSIDNYLASLGAPERAALEHIRHLVKQLVPEAEETISYGIPTLKYKGKPLVHFAAFKNHLSLFPTAGPGEALRHKLTGYTLAKGTIQFTLAKPLPDELIGEIIALRLADIAGHSD